MATMVPPTVVPAPQPRGLRYGLLTAAAGPLDLPVSAYTGGLIYQPASCGWAYRTDATCPPSAGPQKTFDNGVGNVTAFPFVAYATLNCGTAGTSADDATAQVVQRLANGEQSIAEQALGAAVLAAAPPLLHPPAPHKFSSVVGELEQWLYGRNGGKYGNVGFLLAPIRMAAEASNAGHLIDGSPVWTTPMGTIWVFGDFVDDGTIYATGQVTLWRAPEMNVPSAEQSMDRLHNQWNLLAEREYAVAWDCVAARAVYEQVAS